jgi:hypothetical protein
MWWELRLTTMTPFSEENKDHNDTHKFQGIKVEFVWMLLRKSGPFPQAERDRNDADDLYGGYTDSNGFLRRLRG